MRAINNGHTTPFCTKARLRFVSLLAIVILIQQFAFASLHNSLFFGGIHSTQLQFTAKLPAKPGAVLVNLDVEVAEEDEVQHPEQKSHADLSTLYTILRRLYCSTVNNSYLSQAYAIEAREDIPLFLLHHSWKTHLS
jgi:hypothetical protein